MATVKENKNGKVISFRFTICLERDVRGRQIAALQIVSPAGNAERAIDHACG